MKSSDLISVGTITPDTNERYVVAYCGPHKTLKVGDVVSLKKATSDFNLVRLSDISLHSIYMGSAPGEGWVLVVKEGVDLHGQDEGLNVWECRVDAAMELIERYGGIDGAHHKQWVLDQVARRLKAHKYEKWVESMTENDDEDAWDVGIAP